MDHSDKQKERRAVDRMDLSGLIGRRKHWRRAFLTAVDQAADRPIGHLSDISERGFRILSEKALEIGVRYDLRVELPYPIDGSEVIRVGVWCRWSLEGEVAGLYYAGCEIQDISEPDRQRLTAFLASR